jgi:hypothetical protein
MHSPIADKVIEQLSTLPHELQCRVLELARALALSAPHGVPGQKLLRFAGTIPISDVQLMHEAIQQNCEQVESDEW